MYYTSLSLSLSRYMMGTAPPQPSTIECCMCGDYGLSYELFKCKICQFRSQHRYCSNQYPKAESYRICNWCLIDTTEKTLQNSSNSPLPNRGNTQLDHDHVIKKKKIYDGKSDNHGGQNGQNGSPLKPQANNSPLKPQANSSPIKKLQKSPEGSSRKRVTATAAAVVAAGGGGGGGVVEEKLTRTKSEEVSNIGGAHKQVFRNKVRRYKLLDEVSSQ